jgi:transcriptional regulator with PAS, ATPase and Fis domain
MPAQRPSFSDAEPLLPGIIGAGPAMQKVFRVTRQAAKSDASVILLGETGTGKEVIAQALHRLSHRKAGPLIRVNCGALSENLLESELFGHVRGSFTGAIDNRTGRFEAAHMGSIFLDEINSTSLQLQVKLLRVLQEREFERVGDTKTVSVDVRVIAASNRDLPELINEEKFREDLYWRLNVIPIHIPPLRQRREDISDLASHFLQFYSEANGRHVVHIQEAAIQALQDYSWPGNVRELQNYMERAVVMAEGDELSVDLLPDVVLGKAESKIGSLRGADLESLVHAVVELGLQAAGEQAEDLHSRIVSRIERELLIQVMNECNQVQTKTATRLGINRNTLHKKLKEHDLNFE